MLANDSSNIVKVIKENYEVGLYIDLMQCFIRNTASILKVLRPLYWPIIPPTKESAVAQW